MGPGISRKIWIEIAPSRMRSELKMVMVMLGKMASQIIQRKTQGPLVIPGKMKTLPFTQVEKLDIEKH